MYYPLLLLVLLCLAACSSEEGGDEPRGEPRVMLTAAEAVESYREFIQMTDGPVLVDPQIAMLCAAPSDLHDEESRRAYGPHADAEVVIYMNESAARAFRGSAESYPVGAVVVKEKQPLSSPTGYSGEGVGGMIKRAPGYDPDHGDWEYFYRDTSTPLQHGPIASCIQCHAAAAETDYVYGDWAVDAE